MLEPCPLCKSHDSRIAYRLTDYHVAACASCGFEYNDGFRGGGDDDEVFSEDYYKVLQEDAFRAQFEDWDRDPSADAFRKWLGRIEARLGVGRILDVGSALGTFLKIAQERGWKPQGVEISRFAADFARERRGLPVFHGDLASFECSDGAFDVVTFWDSIEHVTHPLENLRTAARLLRPGGLVLLTTDNFDCLLGDVGRLAYRISAGRFRYPMERVFIPVNRSYFTEQTFRQMLGSCGLKVAEFEKMEYPLEKIRTNPLERWILKSFYVAGKLLGRQAQFTVLAEKPASGSAATTQGA